MHEKYCHFMHTYIVAHFSSALIIFIDFKNKNTSQIKAA